VEPCAKELCEMSHQLVSANMSEFPNLSASDNIQMFHEEPWNGKGACTRWKIATHCSTNRSRVEQCVAIFHRALTPCHYTALSETFVLYDTSNVNKSDFNPKSESLNIKVFPKWPKRAEITLTVCVTSDRATTRMDVARVRPCNIQTSQRCVLGY